MSPIRTQTGVTAACLAIPYTSTEFPSSYGVGSGTLSFSWNDLLWAAIMIGRPNTAHVFQHGDASLYEALFRFSLVRMALEQFPCSGRLHRTDAFRALDPTEKGAISYFLGMATCKLFASQLLNTPWLLHLDVFRDQYNAQNLGRSRPDLIGRDVSGAWHAFETKGRSSVPSSADKRKAKAQAQRLVSVDDSPCSLHIGSIAFFRQDELEFYWRDPEPEEPQKLKPIEIQVVDADWANYYAPALALVSQSESAVFSDQAEKIDLKVEIHPDVCKLLLKGQWADAREFLADDKMRQMLKAENFKPDGLRILAGDSWHARFKGTEGK